MKTRHVFLVTGGIALGVAAGVGIGAALHLGAPASAEPARQDLLPVEMQQHDTDGNLIAMSNFPVNASGQTYGSSMLARNRDEIPDLVSVWVDETTIGYVPKDILDPASPDDFGRQIDAGQRRDGQVMAYKSDGKTQLGWVDIEGTVVPSDQIPNPNGNG